MTLARLVAIFIFVCCATAARADAVDDALAKFLDNKFASTEQGVNALAATGAANAPAILDALGDNRLLIDPVAHIIVYQTTGGDLINAKTGEKLSGVGADSFKKVRVNNALRSAIAAAVGALTVLDAQLSHESDPHVAEIMRQARAAIVVLDPKTPTADRVAAVATLKARGDQDAQSLIDEVAAKTDDPAVKTAALAAEAAIKAHLAWLNILQNLIYGVSAASVLLLAAIGLAITFGVMGVINMAHGEMVMLGAYSTFVVQSALPPSFLQWSLAVALPLAFLVSAIVGVAIERLVIRHLYGRPLETLLATWGVSLILQQAVRSLFGANNRQVIAPNFMSGSFDWAGLQITTGRLWIVALAILVFAALQLALRATSFGLRMRAVTQNRRMAAAMGISTGRIDMFAFALGSGVAGVAGVALSQIDNVSPNLGQGYIIDSFMVVVLGGVGNLWGTLLGAMVLGVANKLLEPVIGAVLGKILLLVFIILFIQKRPRGLFALKGRAVEA